MKQQMLTVRPNSQLHGIDQLVHGSPYQAYTYSYPHKTAYRIFDSSIPLSDVWATENRNALFLYLHVPFCEHRCGFCNLFTQANPEQGLTERYVRQIHAEAQQVRESLGREARFAQLAIGGGTPTFLNCDELSRLLNICLEMGADGNQVPVSIEVSPATVDAEKLAMLSDFGADRISIGIQSFNEAEAHRLGRPQRTEDVINALDLIRAQSFPVLNIDLIYGGEGQSVGQWIHCVREALRWNPEELYLYPLYVRPLTGLGRQDRTWDDQRLEAYREARDLLVREGYEQTSMRMFRRPLALRQPKASEESSTPAYTCQSDGMVGLGCGARSYTRSLHYSTEFAVGRQGVRSILLDYINRDPSSFAAARNGFLLSPDDQQRRFAILMLLQVGGLYRREYAQRFGRDVLEDLPELSVLPDHDFAVITTEKIVLTQQGIERSDALGPWLYSDSVRSLMQDFELV